MRLSAFHMLVLFAVASCSRPSSTEWGATPLESAAQEPQVRDSAGAVALGCRLLNGIREPGVPSSCRFDQYIEDSVAYVLRVRGHVSAAAVGPGSYSMAELRIPKDGNTVTVTYFAE
jgi:hypothetical protein